MKIALIHDWLTGMRGGEKVLEQLCLIYPQADIYTLVHYPEEICDTINNHRVTTSFIQRLPAAKRRYQWYLPLFPSAIERFDLTEYDLVISTSHCVAKGVITRPGTCHISYIHAPMRYAWEMYHQYFSPQQSAALSRLLIPLFMPRLRVWDRVSADRADFFIANSKHTARRINKHYRRTANVIYPPIDTDFFTLGQIEREDFFLIVSALVPYKRVDIAIQACKRLKTPLVIIGKGVQAERLKQMAGPDIQFLGHKSKEEIRSYYRRCKALLFPGEEDCGMVPIEAQSCGAPVIAYGVGGALETVSAPGSGLFFQEQSSESLCEALQKFAKRSFDSQQISKNVLSFGEKSFRAQMKQFIEEKFNHYQRGGNIPHA